MGDKKNPLLAHPATCQAIINIHICSCYFLIKICMDLCRPPV